MSDSNKIVSKNVHAFLFRVLITAESTKVLTGLRINKYTPHMPYDDRTSHETV